MKRSKPTHEDPTDWAEYFWLDDWKPVYVPDSADEDTYVATIKARAAEFKRKFPHCPLTESDLVHDFIAQD